MKRKNMGLFAAAAALMVSIGSSGVAQIRAADEAPLALCDTFLSYAQETGLLIGVAFRHSHFC